MYVDEEGRLSYFSIVGEEVSEALNLISFTMNIALWDDQLFRIPIVPFQKGNSVHKLKLLLKLKAVHMPKHL